MSYLEFTKELQGFTFWSGTKQVYRFELYWSGLTPLQCFEKFQAREIINVISY